MRLYLKGFICCLALTISVNVKAQISNGTNTNGSNSNTITTAVPFLTISPDARSGALGDAGVAISPDVNSTYWNPSKLVFIENKSSASLSYSPWLRHILPNGVQLLKRTQTAT